MITITVHPDSIDLSGHALYNPGNDIVCAGVSALVQTFQMAVWELTDVNMYISRAPDGYIKRMAWDDDVPLPPAFNTLLDAFTLGIGSIAESYPDNVKLST